MEAAESSGLRLVGHSNLDGHGDASQLIRSGDYLFVGHMGNTGTTIVDVSDPTRPRVVRRLPLPTELTHAHKVQIAGHLLVVNHELAPSIYVKSRRPDANDGHSAGLQLYDISDPHDPKPVSFFATGGRGVHRMWFVDERFIYASVRPPGYRERMLMIVDVSDPPRPREVGRWWVPGTWEAGGEAPPEGLHYAIHHAIVHGNRAYVGCYDAGVAIVNISDPARPRTLTLSGAWPEPSRNTHTVLPLPERKLVIATEEAWGQEGWGGTPIVAASLPRRVRVIDVSDERHPVEVGRLPTPNDSSHRAGRFGPHNLHENRPGSLVDDRVLYLTYFNAGLRVVDISDARAPKEVAWYVPKPLPGQQVVHMCDVFVDRDGLIYVSDRAGGGVYILERI